MFRMGEFFDIDGTDITQKMIVMARDAMFDHQGGRWVKKSSTINMGEGLYAYDLEAPAKNLYVPKLAPITSRLSRETKATGAGDGPKWKVVTAVTHGGVRSMAWIPEGKRAPRMIVDTEPASASYCTIGEEFDITSEARRAGMGFEDLVATGAMRALQSIRQLEEYAVLGGNRSVSLGTPSAPTVTGLGSGGTIPDGTYNVACVALTMEGALDASLDIGVRQAVTVTPVTGATYSLNAGSSNKSTTTSVVLAGGDNNTIKAFVPVVRGAFGYAWFAGPADSETLQAITTLNSVVLTSLTDTYQPLTEITADCSRNATYAFDGLLYSALNSPLSYYHAMPTGVEGVGTGFTSDGNGGIVEINDMFQYDWDNFRMGPDELHMSSRTYKAIKKAASQVDSTATMWRLSQTVETSDIEFGGGRRLAWLMNDYSSFGPKEVPIIQHPYIPDGVIMGWCLNLPPHYVAANVAQTASIQCSQDYHVIEWPMRERAHEWGVYSIEVLKVYAPFAIGMIVNGGVNP